MGVLKFMRTTVGVFVAIVIVAFFLSAESIATPIYGTVTMDPAGYGAKGTMTIWGGGWSGVSVYAGVQMFNKTAGTEQGEYIDNGYIGGFCMDLSEYVAHDSLTYDVIMPEDGPRPTYFLGTSMGQNKADYIAELWGRFYDSAWSTGDSYTYQQNKDAEAFAAAIWEIVYEDLPTSSAGWDVTVDGTDGSKGFKATNLDYLKTNTWLHALDGTGPIADLRVLSAVGAQDFIVAVQDPGVIPEPSSVAIFAISSLCFIIKRNRTSSY